MGTPTLISLVDLGLSEYAEGEETVAFIEVMLQLDILAAVQGQNVPSKIWLRSCRSPFLISSTSALWRVPLCLTSMQSVYQARKQCSQRAWTASCLTCSLTVLDMTMQKMSSKP